MPPAARVLDACKGLKQTDLAEVAAHFFHLAGGARAVAKLLLDEFRDPRTTPFLRSKILYLILWMTKSVTDKAGPADDLGLLQEKDLEERLTTILSQLPEASHDRPPPNPPPTSTPDPTGDAGASAGD